MVYCGVLWCTVVCCGVWLTVHTPCHRWLAATEQRTGEPSRSRSGGERDAGGDDGGDRYGCGAEAEAEAEVHSGGAKSVTATVTADSESSAETVTVPVTASSESREKRWSGHVSAVKPPSDKGRARAASRLLFGGPG